MKILVHPHAAEIGGSQLNAVDLAAAVRDRGHDVVVACEAGPLVDRIHERGLEHLHLPTGGRRPSPASAARLERFVVEHRIDVVHAYEWPPVFDALGARMLHGIPVVGTVLSMSVVPFYPRTVPLLVGTEQIRRAALAAGCRRATVLEPPVDTAGDHPDHSPGDFRRQVGLDPDAMLIAMVCRLVPQLKLEGLLAACDATAELSTSGRRAQLVIVGDGPCRAAVAERARLADTRAGRRIAILAGQRDDPRPAYAAADVVVGQGGSALRGMAFGKPVIVVGENGFSELVTPDSTPLFLDGGWFGLGPGSRGAGVPALTAALSHLVDRPERRRELGAFGRRLVVERFGLDHAAELLEDEYRSAVEVPQIARQIVDLGRSVAGMVVHKARRRLARRHGTVPTDDANARTALVGAAGTGGQR